MKMFELHRLCMISGSDWVSFGVLYYKSCQTSKAGNSYTLCKLSDLQG